MDDTEVQNQWEQDLAYWRSLTAKEKRALTVARAQLLGMVSREYHSGNRYDIDGRKPIMRWEFLYEDVWRASYVTQYDCAIEFMKQKELLHLLGDGRYVSLD